MNFEEAWKEGKDKLLKQKAEIEEMLKNPRNPHDQIKLDGKLNGIKVAIENIRQIESSIDDELVDFSPLDIHCDGYYAKCACKKFDKAWKKHEKLEKEKEQNENLKI